MNNPNCKTCGNEMREYRPPFRSGNRPGWHCKTCKTTIPYSEASVADEPVTYDSGEPIASTLGFFVSLLIDGGTDDAVIFRVTDRTESDERGRFRQTIEVEVIPNGQVLERIEARGVEHVHKTLALAIERGVMR